MGKSRTKNAAMMIVIAWAARLVLVEAVILLMPVSRAMAGTRFAESLSCFHVRFRSPSMNAMSSGRLAAQNSTLLGCASLT